MNTPQRSFDQVKSILGKLDRNIDAARARRTQDHVPPAAVTTTPASLPPPAPIPVSTAMPAATANGSLSTPTTPANNPRSPFGRATPMRFTRPAPLNNTGT